MKETPLKLANDFIVVIAACNCEALVGSALQSVLNQNFKNLGIIIRDDVSEDGTADVITQLTGLDGLHNISTHQNGKDLIFIRNTHKLYGGGNTYDSVITFAANPQAIIGVVDGDDKLIDNDAIQKIYDVYQTRDVWMVWSQHQAASRINRPIKGFSNALPPDEFIRSSRSYWSISHFRTSKAWLFGYLDRNDLIDPFNNESYYKILCDAAFLYPFAELCGNNRSFFLDEILYWYNDQLDTNDHFLHQMDVPVYTDFVREKARRYSALRTENDVLINYHE